MLKCNGKTFMNLQEAVQWLLNNNALFFMCNENYAADTEISLEELVNPSPANPKIGSLVLFADGSIAAITGITDDSFTVGSDYINIRLEKTVTHFSIDASQHLIVHYSDGTTDDLGSILSGNVNIDGTLTADVAKIFEEIVDNDDHRRFIEGDVNLNSAAPAGITKVYGKWSLSGSHLMMVLVLGLENGLTLSNGLLLGSTVGLPNWIIDKLHPIYQTYIDNKTFVAFAEDYSSQSFVTYCDKATTSVGLRKGGSLTLSADRNVRIQFDFLIDNE